VQLRRRTDLVLLQLLMCLQERLVCLGNHLRPQVKGTAAAVAAAARQSLVRQLPVLLLLLLLPLVLPAYLLLGLVAGHLLLLAAQQRTPPGCGLQERPSLLLLAEVLLIHLCTEVVQNTAEVRHQ
jgi:hypothetical protein